MIAPTAIIDPSARIAEDVRIGHYSVIGPNVEIGPGCIIGHHVVLEGPMVLGARNRVFPFAFLGCIPQDLSFRGEDSRVEIGNDNTIREYVTIHRGTEKQNCVTRIGSNNLIMGYVHIAHDCTIGSHCILANAVQMAGHVVMEDFAALGGMVAVHQFVRIGRYCFVGGFTPVTQDVMPFSLIAGERARLRGVNKIGLQRKGFDVHQRSRIHKAFRYLMNPEFTVTSAVQQMRDEFGEDPDVEAIIAFIHNSERGVTL
ncbi:acyl-ACP--UDP-N-acetylglucosamine O-acyltransferase [bacterium]|nr:acyl-ACP--UDP-N-acetylglucosamine O-acyltransferase [candidate division CSSED10-310 bacterium]